MSGAPPVLEVDYCGERTALDPSRPFRIGREGDLDVDDNPFLHRHFLQVVRAEDLWWLANVGSRLSATVTDGQGGFHAWLNPGARLPLVFATTTVIFTAGPTTYEFLLHLDAPAFHAVQASSAAGEVTIGEVPLTASQRRLILALAEPILRHEGTGTSAIPSSARAAERLGWPITRFNRKLDNVCDKFDRAGIAGLRGTPGRLASNRRARLVEYAIGSRIVLPSDLALLDAASPALPEDD